MVQIGAGATGRKRRAASDEAAARFDDTPTESREALGSFALSLGFIASARNGLKSGGQKVRGESVEVGDAIVQAGLQSFER